MLQFEYLIAVPTRRFGEIGLYFSKNGKYLWVNRHEAPRDDRLRQLLGEPEKQTVSIDVKDVLHIQSPESHMVSVGRSSRTLESLAEDIYSHYLQTGRSMTVLRTPKDALNGVLNRATDLLLGMFPQLNWFSGTPYFQELLREKGSQYAQEPSPRAYALAIHEKFRR